MEEAPDSILLSAITQYAYCPRRCMLIHLEGEFEENVFTLEGRTLHERTDQPITTFEEGKRVERAMPLWSDKLGLRGKADTVEFYDDGTVRPVEYKRGSRRPQRPDDLQICGQALCLEEMLGMAIGGGAIFYHESRHCREVSFDSELREETIQVVEKIKEMIHGGYVPPPVDDARCPNCSLLDACMPSALRALAGVQTSATLFTPLREEEIR